VNWINEIKRSCASILFISLVLVSAWLGVPGNISIANAATLTTHSHLIAFDSQAATNFKENARKDIDKSFGAGSSNKFEGKAEEAFGTVERNKGKVVGQAKGAAKQAEGKVKQNLGRTKNAIEDASDKVEQATENTVDKVKGFFNK
jgi:uncharacterized protein YjbJ (UPF0337 family)